jgi:hypothetical protein
MEAFALHFAECFHAVERRRLNRVLAAAACVASATDDVENYRQHCCNIAILTANAEARCVIGHDEASELRREWVRAEVELHLYKLAPARRRDALLDPAAGPQRFVLLRKRRKMLTEIDEELRWGKRSGANERTP